MIQIYNSLTRKKEELTPGPHGALNMFVCGPTVYDYIHIGNARTFVIFDMIAKYIRYRDLDLYYIQNITDIDDKILRRAAEQDRDPLEFAKEYEKHFLANAKALGITGVDRYVRATDHIGAIIKQVQTLLDKGYAYEISDGLYFDLSKFPDYGKLSGRTSLGADDAVSRIDENEEKRNPGDFALWKRSKDDEPSWPAPWFPGRPGWHIEDTAITETFFGPQYDLHGGAKDLIFPHHEAEITQQESASGKKPFVRYWMHAEFLINKDVKMSKSLGNLRTAHELLKEYPKEVLRLYLLSAHYRTQLDFTEKALAQAEAGIQRISEFMTRLEFLEDKEPLAHKKDANVAKVLDEVMEAVLESMDDDFNTPKAVGHLFDMIRLGNQYLDKGQIDMHSAKKMLHIFDLFDHILGIIPHKRVKLSEEVSQLVKERESAREGKNYSRSDELRDQISALGYQIDDTSYGPLVKKAANNR